jgi:hypothetical protein
LETSPGESDAMKITVVEKCVDRENGEKRGRAKKKPWMEGRTSLRA